MMSFRTLLYASLGVTTMLLAACTSTTAVPAPEVPAPRKVAGWRTEPVIYNGRRYRVAFRKREDGQFDVRISAPGRQLGHSAGDGRIMRAVAEAAVHHFHCRSSQTARLHDVRPENGRWLMVASCG